MGAKASTHSGSSSDITNGAGNSDQRSTANGSGSNGATGNHMVRNIGRARSLSIVPDSNNASMSIPRLLARNLMASETAGSSLEDEGPMSALEFNRVVVTHSLPAHLWSLNDFRCPVCSKMMPYDDIECHLIMCLTKPKIIYNEDVLSEDKGECVICLEELCQGDTIARLPCLCIYHKTCIDQWFQINRICPEHPYD